MAVRTYAKPEKPATGHRCKCRADINDNISQNVGKQPTFEYGEAWAMTCDEAIRKAKKEAGNNLGAQAKHTACKCNPEC